MDVRSSLFHEALEPKQNPPVRYPSVDPLSFTFSSLFRLKHMVIRAVASFYDTTKFYRYNCNDSCDHRSPGPAINQLLIHHPLKSCSLTSTSPFIFVNPVYPTIRNGNPVPLHVRIWPHTWNKVYSPKAFVHVVYSKAHLRDIVLHTL